jgi:hypothetical protein
MIWRLIVDPAQKKITLASRPFRKKAERMVYGRLQQM